MDKILLLPPIAFLILLIAGYLISLSFSKLAVKGHESAGKFEQYACGEDIPAQHLKPDYSQFFPFAIFFIKSLIVGSLVGLVAKRKEKPEDSLTLQ